MKKKEILKKINRYYDAFVPSMREDVKNTPLQSEPSQTTNKSGSKRVWNKKFVLLAATICCLVVLCGGIAMASLLPLKDGTTVFVTVDINPSVQFITDASGKIASAAAQNEAASLLLEKLSLKGKTLSDGVLEVVNAAIRLGYIDLTQQNRYPNALMISSLSDKETLAENIKNSAAQSTIDYFKQKGIKCAVLTHYQSKENLVSILTNNGMPADSEMSVSKLNAMLGELHVKQADTSQEVYRTLQDESKIRYFSESQILKWQNNLIRNEIKRAEENIANTARVLESEKNANINRLLYAVDNFAERNYNHSLIRILQTGMIPSEIKDSDIAFIESAALDYQSIVSLQNSAVIKLLDKYGNYSLWLQTLRYNLSKLVSSPNQKTNAIVYVFDTVSKYSSLESSAEITCRELQKMGDIWLDCNKAQAIQIYRLNLSIIDSTMTAKFAPVISDFRGEVQPEEYDEWNELQKTQFSNPDVWDNLYKSYTAFMKFYFTS